jgi:hypothetical protein
MAKPTKKVTKPPTKTGISAIDELNLDQIVATVRKERHWTAKTAKDAETWYRLFLAVSRMSMGKRKNVTAAFGLDESADFVWHEHIVNTKRYRKDCAKIFGRGTYLDHTPGKPKGWRARLSKSAKAYDKAFGTHPRNFRVCCT